MSDITNDDAVVATDDTTMVKPVVDGEETAAEETEVVDAPADEEAAREVEETPAA